MKQAAVIGTPISHSLSPAIFEFLRESTGLSDLRYEAREVSVEGLQAFLAEVRGGGDWVGFNVTLPHKQSVLAGMDETTPEVKAVGALNVVRVAAGKLSGHNTDVIGVVKTLQQHQARVEGEAVWIWGAGGAARATAYALGSLGARTVHVCNRDVGRARGIAEGIGALFPRTAFLAIEGDAAAIDGPLRLVINATSVGMKGTGTRERGGEDFFGRLRQLPLHAGAVALDLIYNPQETPFLALAKKCGLRPVGGLDMLIYQALATWELWFGEDASLMARQPALSAHIQRILRGAPKTGRPVFLTGFMGVGKSHIGAILAERLGWRFVDTDHLVEQQAGTTIARLFETQGEESFRQLESAVVRVAAGYERTVVALGGGALMNVESLRAVEQAGELVFLDASAEYLQKRLSRNAAKRPLLAGQEPATQLKTIRDLMTVRRPVYERARIKVETDGKEAAEVAEIIAQSLDREGA